MVMPRLGIFELQTVYYLIGAPVIRPEIQQNATRSVFFRREIQECDTHLSRKYVQGMIHVADLTTENQQHIFTSLIGTACRCEEERGLTVK